ncbi:hypothetical protein GY25_21595 [Pedobacter himalayensis]|nr:hypothetical protein GY25_21595 [Pedobacter himalayensis]
MFSESGFTHSDLLRGHNQYVGRSLKVNGSFCRVIYTFPNENSLLKLLYLGLMNTQEKWIMPIQSCNLTLSQLAIYFEGRLNNVMTL